MLIHQIKTPDLLALYHFNHNRYYALLESVGEYKKTGRYSLLLMFPEQHISLNAVDTVDFLAQLDTELQHSSNNTSNSKLPFVGGWMVAFAYDFATLIHSKLNTLPQSQDSVAYAIKTPCAIVLDKLHNSCFFVDEKNDESRYKVLLQDLATINNNQQHLEPLPSNIATDFSVDDPNIFLDNVEQCLQYIKAGDIFQANLSRTWSAELTSPIKSSQIYAKLRQTNPALSSALVNLGDLEIISSSPERLFCVKNQIIETRPIAGTHPRGANKQEDEMLAKMLKEHSKEIAEHTMLIDLERSDLGKICQTGSIAVDELMILESYKFVHHLVSNIVGKLKNDIKFSDIIKAIFPGGSITGCPKIRCMQIIGELEQQPRKFYTGSLGYISNNGNMDFNILIRSIMRTGNSLKIQAGSGIVHDSVAKQELLETEHKAAGMLSVFKNLF